jgi:hypothetical protein
MANDVFLEPTFDRFVASLSSRRIFYQREEMVVMCEREGTVVAKTASSQCEEGQRGNKALSLSYRMPHD